MCACTRLHVLCIHNTMHRTCDISADDLHDAQRHNQSSLLTVFRPLTRILIPRPLRLARTEPTSFISGAAASEAVSDAVDNQPGRLSSRYAAVLPVRHRGAFKAMTNCGCDAILSGGRIAQPSHLHNVVLFLFNQSATITSPPSLFPRTTCSQQ